MFIIISAAPPGHVCYSNEHCRLWDKESRCEFVILNLFGRCACNSYYKQIGDKCVAQKVPTLATEAVVAEQDSVVAPTNGTYKDSSPTVQLALTSDNTFGSPVSIVGTDDILPSKLPMYTNKNDVFNTNEDSPLMQAVMKVPNVEPTKRLPVSNRKDGEPNETIRVDEMTANLHANDQPIYRVVTQPTVEKKANKKGGSSKEQVNSGSKPHKSGHQKKSSLKGTEEIMNQLFCGIN